MADIAEPQPLITPSIEIPTASMTATQARRARRQAARLRRMRTMVGDDMIPSFNPLDIRLIEHSPPDFVGRNLRQPPRSYSAMVAGRQLQFAAQFDERGCWSPIAAAADAPSFTDHEWETGPVTPAIFDERAPPPAIFDGCTPTAVIVPEVPELERCESGADGWQPKDASIEDGCACQFCGGAPAPIPWSRDGLLVGTRMFGPLVCNPRKKPDVTVICPDVAGPDIIVMEPADSAAANPIESAITSALDEPIAAPVVESAKQDAELRPAESSSMCTLL